MCGIFGVIGTDNIKQAKSILQQGMYINGLRGFHSSGLFTVSHKDYYTDIFKMAAPVYEFLEDTKVQRMADPYFSRAIVTHNRMATHGNVNIENAHPHMYKNIVLVHNGSLFNHHTLHKNAGTSDSRAIALSLADNGIDDTLSKLDGSFSLVWYDKDTRKLHFYRNSLRPMVFHKAKAMDTMWFGSEEEMLALAIKRNGGVITNFVSTDAHKLYSFQMDAAKIVATEEVRIVNPSKRAVVTHNVPTIPAHYAGGSNGYSNKGTQHSTAHTNRARKKACKQAGVDYGEFYEFFPTSFKHYVATGGNGYLKGWMIEEPYHEVIVHDVLPSNAARILKLVDEADNKAVFLGRAKNATEVSNVEGAWLVSLDGMIEGKDDATSTKESDTKYTDANGKQISQAQWKLNTKNGCCACGATLVPGKVEWPFVDKPMCQDCHDVWSAVKQ